MRIRRRTSYKIKKPLVGFNHVKIGDTVKIISGDNKGSQGVIMSINKSRVQVDCCKKRTTYRPVNRNSRKTFPTHNAGFTHASNVKKIIKEENNE